MMTKWPIVFTDRILNEIWACMQTSRVISNNPNAPSEEGFLAHYTQANPAPVFAWPAEQNGVTYHYDLYTNQVAVTPPVKPFVRRVTILNNRLREVLHPDLLVTSDNWKKAWLDAARHTYMPTIQFLIEQGFDVNTFDDDYSTALNHAVAPYGGNYRLVKLLVESGADLSQPSIVEDLIRAGREGVTSGLEATEAAQIATYLRARVDRN